ncbi:hypothetical protein M9H77_02907 [Catharanthus roseus]|uniref:Uncharacterized protein n=1 Tax=Catharanthus roseus TaxID=4058 RepID=A0ACC0C9Q0_CATRO|nr:hypothetical protein M9H77_02907 [Catharanthus roseus]
MEESHPTADGGPAPTVTVGLYWLIMSMDGHIPTQSHQEGTSDPTRMNLNETLRSMQQSIEGLARQFQIVAIGVEELKKGKSSDTMEQRVGDNLGGFNSPHHQRPFDNVELLIPWHGGSKFLSILQRVDTKEDNKLEHKPTRVWPKKEDTPKVVFKDHSKPNVEEKGKLITNPRRCFKCNRVGYIAINCPTKRILGFSEDLNCWIEKSDDDFQEGIVDKDESSEDQDIDSFEADKEGPNKGTNWRRIRLCLEGSHPTADSRPAPTVAIRPLPAILLEDVTYCARSSRFCSWGFEALVSLRSLPGTLGTEPTVDTMPSSFSLIFLALALVIGP